ncbi:MAG TPA: hypothetical protein VK858_15215 [Longimicrobiales bacterium]|nr:hypothetical protein [Longimicrobiales bacterium]
MRERNQILDSLERVYREAFQTAAEREDAAAMSDLDFQFQRDQVKLEVLLDIRDLLTPREEAPSVDEKVGGLLDTAQKIKKIKNLTRLP